MKAFSKDYFKKEIKSQEILQTIKKVIKTKYNSKTKNSQQK